MVSSLDNWDGSLSSTSKQNSSRITDLAENARASNLNTTTTVPDERSNTLGNGQGWHELVTGLDLNYAVRCLFGGFCILAQVAVYLVRRVKLGSSPIA